MKLDPKFKAENGKLFFLDGKEFDSTKAQKIDAADFIKNQGLTGTEVPYAVLMPWSKVGLDEDSYDEDFLAKLRDVLKDFEEKNCYAIIVPVADSAAESAVQKENLTASMKHCARRIKDCENVIGFSVPAEVDQSFFIEELSAKHKQYIFFSGDFKTL